MTPAEGLVLGAAALLVVVVFAQARNGALSTGAGGRELGPQDEGQGVARLLHLRRVHRRRHVGIGVRRPFPMRTQR